MPADKPDTKKPWLVDGEVLDDWTSRWVHPSRLDYNGAVALDRLIRAAPALARALCRIEWPEGYCGECRAERPYGHQPGCGVDAALTAAGLSHEDRMEVRRG